MNKKLLSVAVATAMALPMVANAGSDVKSKVYGAVHVAGQYVDDGHNDATIAIAGDSRKGSKFGIKGEMKTNLMDFMAIGQYEIGLDMSGKTAKSPSGSTAGVQYQRDSWVGLSSKTMGKIRMGTMATSYKGNGKFVDPFFTTAVEGRGFLGIQSSQMHAGTGDGRGRSTNTVRYDSPNLGVKGLKASVNYNVAPGAGAANNMGFGLKWMTKDKKTGAFFDAQMIGEGNYVNGGAEAGNAMKIGGKYTTKGFTVSGQYEIDGCAISKDKDNTTDIWFLAGAYKMKKTTFILTLGGRAEMGSNENDRMGWAIGAKHGIAKGAALYAAFGSVSGGDGFNGGETMSAAAVGAVAKF